MSNSQAIRNQLIAAIIMCLVAAIALGASTFAWFVNNNTATADGMKVQAKAESGLLIRLDKTTNAGDWNTTASANMTDAKIILPTSTLDSSWWTHTNAIAATKSAAATGVSRENVTTTVLGGNTLTINGELGGLDSNYASIRQFEFAASTANSKQGLKVNSVTATVATTGNDAKAAMMNALRVGIKCGNTFLVYSPVDSKTTAYTVYNTSGTAETTQVTLTSPTTSTVLDSTTVLPAAAGDSNLFADVFIWFEGEDADLYTNNFSDQNVSISIEFASNDYTTGA